MDGSAAIEQNRLALKRITLSLMAMAGLDTRPDAEGRTEGPHRPTLPRHLWLAILRLLRPAEAAARRLIIAAARGLTVTLPPPRKPAPKPLPAVQLLRRLGIAVTMSSAQIARTAATAKHASAPAPTRPRRLSLPLCDPPRRYPHLHPHPEPVEGEPVEGEPVEGEPVERVPVGRHPHPEPVEGSKAHRRTVPAHAAPRIMLPGVIEPHRLPPPPSADDPVSAVRLHARLAALAAALDDLPGQARRFARWKARRDRGLTRRIWPLRAGRPPGGRLSRLDPTARRHGAGKSGRAIRAVDEILAHAHALALDALESPDTS